MEIYESNLDLYICCCCIYTEISYILKISLLSNLSDIKNNLVLKLEPYFENCEMNHYIINNKLTKVIEFHDRNSFMCIKEMIKEIHNKFVQENNDKSNDFHYEERFMPFSSSLRS